MHHTELDVPSRGSDAIVCHSVTLGPVHKSGITSRDVLLGVRMLHAYRTGYLCNLIEWPGACLSLKRHRTLVALTLVPMLVGEE